ncbi:MAG: hypothetical protein ACXVCY_08195 [Pseudobdellovibrionaceae bacterium]
MFTQNKILYVIAALGFTVSACSSFNRNQEKMLSAEAANLPTRIPAEQSSPPMTESELMGALVDKDIMFDYSCKMNQQTAESEITVHFFNDKTYTAKTFDFGQAIKKAQEKIIDDGKSRILTSGQYQFVKKNFGMYMLMGNREFAYVYDIRRSIYDSCRHLTDGVGMEDVVSNINVLSLVGPFLSLQEVGSGYGLGAAHPYAYQTNHAFDARTMRNGGNKNTRVVSQQAKLLDLVTQESLITALQADRYLIKNLGKEKLAKAKTLPALIKVMGGLNSCDVSVPSDVDSALSQFSIFDYREQKDLVTIRLGFSYGCEASRGTYTQLGLIVKPTEMFRQYLKEELETARQEKRQPYFGRYMNNH